MPHVRLIQQSGLQLRQQTSLTGPPARPCQALYGRVQLHSHPLAAGQRPCTPATAALPACSSPSLQPGLESGRSALLAEGVQQHTPAAALPIRAARARQRRAHRLRVRKAAAPDPDAARSLDATIFALLLPAMLTVLLEPSMAIIDAGAHLCSLSLLLYAWHAPVINACYSCCSDRRQLGHAASRGSRPQQPGVFLLHGPAVLPTCRHHAPGGRSQERTQ